MARRSRKQEEEKPPARSFYTIELTDEQMEKLEEICDRRVYEFYEVDYARFACRSKPAGVNVVAYDSGKLVIQGRGTEDFVRDILESEVTGDPRLGYDEVHHPEWFEFHAGLDEAGKGDLFGPVVTACVIADGDMVRAWIEKGIRDSKRLTDTSIMKLERIIRRTDGVVVRTAFCGMNRYNQLMDKPNANLNYLLAWLHGRSLEEALAKRRAPWGLLDQFSRKPLVQKYFKDKSFRLEMKVRAESDPVVAAASICARGEFLRQMKKLSDRVGEELVKGATGRARSQAASIVNRLGKETLGEVAKLHFKTARQVLGLPVVERKWVKRS